MSCGSGEYTRLMENYPLVTGGWVGSRPVAAQPRLASALCCCRLLENCPLVTGGYAAAGKLGSCTWLASRAVADAEVSAGHKWATFSHTPCWVPHACLHPRTPPVAPAHPANHTPPPPPPPTHTRTHARGADVFLGLDTEYQRVIADICKKMGAGMADFVSQEEDSGAAGGSSSEVGLMLG